MWVCGLIPVGCVDLVLYDTTEGHQDVQDTSCSGRAELIFLGRAETEGHTAQSVLGGFLCHPRSWLSLVCVDTEGHVSGCPELQLKAKWMSTDYAAAGATPMSMIPAAPKGLTWVHGLSVTAGPVPGLC